MEFFLYRVKVKYPESFYLFPEDMISTHEAVKLAVRSNPTFEIRKAHTWRIGNLSRIDNVSDAFAFGRVHKVRTSGFDETYGNFHEVDYEEAPYTWVLIDYNLQVAAIAKNSKISSKIEGVANNLGRLLNASIVARNFGIEFIVKRINDPVDFIESLRESFTILKFSFTFGLPNPFDAHKDFHKPFENLNRFVHADSARTTLKGPSLNNQVLEEMTKSLAATGEEVTATIKNTEDGPIVKKSLHYNPAVFSIEFETMKNSFLKAIEFTRSTYNRIRDYYDGN